MEHRKRAVVSHSHVLRMVALSQRAVDCATKAYELQDSRFCFQLQDAERSLRELQSMVAKRGRNLQDAGCTLDDDSVPGSCALRIYAGLQITFAAAREIAQNALFLKESRQLADHSPLRWQQAARFANSLVSLNAVALLNRQVRLAKLVLQARQHPGWPLDPVMHAHGPDVRPLDANALFESSVVRCLCAIADQALDIAGAIVRWLGSENCADNSTELAGSLRRIGWQRGTVLLSGMDLSFLCVPRMAKRALPEAALWLIARQT